MTLRTKKERAKAIIDYFSAVHYETAEKYALDVLKKARSGKERDELTKLIMEQKAKAMLVMLAGDGL
jgi:hypothetical protein